MRALYFVVDYRSRKGGDSSPTSPSMRIALERWSKKVRGYAANSGAMCQGLWLARSLALELRIIGGLEIARVRGPEPTDVDDHRPVRRASKVVDASGL